MNSTIKLKDGNKVIVEVPMTADNEDWIRAARKKKGKEKGKQKNKNKE
jgi:predicted DNA-binding antitoxin AbrB/MazE fold protein